LTALDGQAYSVSGDSGSLYLWDAGTGPVGAVSGFSLMESTTDIASELTDLIETQRAYSSSAKIVQTVDEMLQETTNLKR
ncbi:MAG: flagellar basal body rod C-terminal domain-containing protein, partial [Pseudomonadota bacterium]